MIGVGVDPAEARAATWNQSHKKCWTVTEWIWLPTCWDADWKSWTQTTSAACDIAECTDVHRLCRAIETLDGTR